jgi:hypothetical protein
MSIKRSLDRVCSFTFADGRRCRTPRCSKHPYLCYFHAKKEAEALSLQEIGFDIGTWLTGNYVSACDLSAALGRVFSNTAQGKIKPRTASTLAYLGQTIALLGPRAQHEYINAFGTEAWRAQIRSSGELEPGPALHPPPSALRPPSLPQSAVTPAPQCAAEPSKS